MERPSEFDVGAAPEVGEDVYLVFSQLTSAELLTYEELLQYVHHSYFHKYDIVFARPIRWPELTELLDSQALSSQDVSELWQAASVPDGNGNRKMTAKGFDTFVSLCDERQLRNQGEA